MKKICSILILIVLLLNSSVMVLISEAVEAVSGMILGAEEGIQTTQEVVLEKYINYANELDTETIVQLKVGVGLQKHENEEVYVEGTTVSIECPEILGKVPTRVEVIGKESSYENGIITIQEKYEEKLKYEDKQEYTIILFYGADCYTNENQERLLNVKVSVAQTVKIAKAGESVTLTGETTAQGMVTENIGTVISVDYETETLYNGYINSNIQNGTSYNTEYKEKAKIMISNKNIAESFILTSNNAFSFQETDILNNNNLVYKNIIIEKSKIENILGATGEILILNESNEIIDLINNEVETDKDGNYVYTFTEPVENIKLQISNIVKEGIIEFNTTKVIKSTLVQNIDTVKNKLNILGTKTDQVNPLDGGAQEQISEETYTIYEENLENDIAIQEAKETVSMSISKQQLTNNAQNQLTITATLERNNQSNKLFENPTVLIELPEEIEKIILNDVRLLHDTELTKQDAVVETNAEGKQVIRIILSGKQTQYLQSEDISKGTNILISATVMLKQNIVSKDSSIKMICNDSIYEQPIKLVEKNQVMLETSSKQNVEGTVVNSNGLKIDTKVIAGDKILANNETIYEEQILKYEVTLTNTTNSNIDDIKIVGQIPDGMTYVDLVVGGFYDDNYDFVPNDTIKQKEIYVGTLQSGQTETYYYEVKINNLLDTETEKEINSEVKVYIGENDISAYTLSNTINQASIAVELKGLVGRNKRNERVYFAQVSNISNVEQNNVTVTIPLTENLKVKDITIWGKEEGEYETVTNNNSVIVKFNNINKLENLSNLDKNEEGGIGFHLEENQVGIYIVADVVNIEENENYSWNINIAATVSTQDGNIYKSNENRASGYIEAIKVTQTSAEEGETLNKDDEITYIFEVENVGKIIPEWDNYTKVNFRDYIPNELEVTSITYNTSVISINEEDEEQKYSFVNQNIELDSIEIEKINRRDNTDDARVSLDLYIPLKEKSIIKIKAKARTVYDDADISNYSIVTGEYIQTKQSNIIENTIKAKKLVVDTGDADDQKPPVDPEEPDKPIDPDNPDSKKYTISGIAWIDENENGQREETEQKLSGIEVMLLDITNNKYVQDAKGNIITRFTNTYGQYSFENINEGKYYVVFKYNNNDYEITTYQKPGISASMNSDAMKKEATLNGETVFIGLTDIIDLTSNKSNIDIGLIKNKIFDLKVDKYIQKITVQNKAGTKEYDYYNKKIAKVEIPEKQISGSNLIIEYKIVITNIGELAGTVNELIDEMPSGLEFNSELNSNWYKTVGNNLSNTNLSVQVIKPGESVETTLVLTKTLDETIQTYTNIAKIGISDNAKHIADKNIENNSDKVEVIVSIQTGTVGEYIGTILLTILIIAIMLIIILLTAKGVLKNKGIKLLIFIVMIVAIVPIIPIISDGADSYLDEDGNEYIAISRDPVTGEFNAGEFLCTAPGDSMCKGTHMYKEDVEKREILAETRSNTQPDIHISLNKNTDVIEYKLLGDKKQYGPFSISCSTNKDNPNYIISVQGITNLITGEVSEISSYEIVDKYGNPTQLSPDKELYINVPSNIYALTSVKISASVSGSYTSTITQAIIKHYTFVVSDCKWCQNKPVQSMKATKPDVLIYQENGSTNATSTVEWTTELPKTLRIEKVDADDTTIPLPNIKFVIRNDTLGRYVKQNKEDLSITYVVDEADATIFITDEQGYIYVEGLRAGNYTFVEKEIPHDELYHGYHNDKNINSVRQVEIENALIKYKAKNKKLVGNINIEKVNSENSAIKLSNVKFLILNSTGDKYVKVQIQGKSGYQTEVTGSSTVTKQDYTTNIAEATTFITDTNGIISVNNLELQSLDNNVETNNTAQYIVREISNPYYGYELDPDYIIWKVTGGTLVNPTNKGLQMPINIPDKGTTNITVANEQKYVRISGYVWEDRPNGKDNLRNDLCQETTINYQDNNDKLVEGVKVILHNTKTGKSYEGWTDSNGAYLFGSKTGDKYSEDNILLRDINNYYIEFIYNGMKYTNVIPNIAKENGSKSIEGNNRTTFNNKYATVVGNTTKGSNGETQGYMLDANGNRTAEVNYTQPSDYLSQITYTEGNEYADSSKGIKLNDYYAVNKYHISATTANNNYNLRTTYNAHDEEIRNINLGVYEREHIDLAVSSDIEDIHVGLKGYTHTYHYATRNAYLKNDGAFNIGVKFGDKYLNRYTRTIYQSSVTYFAENRNSNKIEVDVVYKITMKNQSSEQLTATFNQINNYYDRKYIPQEVYYMSGETKTPINSWNIGSQTYDNGRLNVLQINLADEYVQGGKTSEIYIRYKVNDETVLGLLNGDSTLDNMTEISSFSTYTSLRERYASVDENSAPGNAEVVLDENNRFIKTTFEDDTDMAPSLVLQADKNNIISGTVFEDSQTQESKNKNERLGNGIYEENTENVVVNAKVELLEVYDDNDEAVKANPNLKGTIKKDNSGNPTIATLYQTISGENGKIEKQVVEAVTYTDDNGNYQFVGIIPDGYAVRYTYGQGTKIKEKGTGNYKEIDTRDYKSTIISSTEIRKALNIQPATATVEGRGNFSWNTIQEKYTDGNIIRYSDAVDEIIERMKQEQEGEILNYSTIRDAIEADTHDMKAITASFIVGVEFENINSVSNVYLRDINGNIVVDENGDPIPDPNFYSENKNIDFGIIQRPIVELVLDKNLTNMSIQLANGQMLVNGNPYEQNLPYTRAIEDNIYVDMDADLIQGAALNMQYEIKLINNSEVDYKFTNLSETDTKAIAGRRYYYFGDSTGAEKIDKYVKLVGDYLDGELVYDINEMNEGLEEGWEIKTAGQLYDEGRISKETRDALIEEKHNIFVTTEFNKGLETSSNPNRATSKTVKVNASKLLGAKDELVFTNDAEILEIYAIARTTGLDATPGNLMPQRAVEKDEDSVKLVIMPPTGANNHLVYIFTGIGSLLLIIVGVILIKKRVSWGRPF